MIAAILNAVGALIRGVGDFFYWLLAKRMTEAGRAEQRLESLKEQVHAAEKALKDRNDVDRGLAASPDRVRDDDGFRRADDG